MPTRAGCWHQSDSASVLSVVQLGSMAAASLTLATAILKPWEGHVELPASRPEGARLRLVVAEFEEYLVDDNRPYDIVPTKKNRRLVFVEHIELA